MRLVSVMLPLLLSAVAAVAAAPAHFTPVVRVSAPPHGYIEVRGRVIDAETRRGIARAAAMIDSTRFGAQTDGSGVFAFNIPSLPPSRTLLVRALGYERQRIRLDSTAPVIDVGDIALEPVYGAFWDHLLEASETSKPSTPIPEVRCDADPRRRALCRIDDSVNVASFRADTSARAFDRIVAISGQHATIFGRIRQHVAGGNGRRVKEIDYRRTFEWRVGRWETTGTTSR